MQREGDSSALTQGANSVLGSPLRLLTGTLIFVLAVFVVSTCGFVLAGWPMSDAAYMVLLTIFSVGYGEIRPVDTTFLRWWTSATIMLGCTGMIVLTGALVQVFTLFQFRRLLGMDRMMTEIEKLDGHVIICGYGRIGVQLAKAMTEAKRPFLILERDHAKADDAKAQGFLCMVGEATHEETLKAAGIARAKVLATVLPDDAANVFITLSARNLNPGIEIIARGENKLFHAGADKVVMPTHIGAERIVEMILYPATGQLDDIGAVRRNLHDFGLDIEMVEMTAASALTGETVGEAERRGNGAFFVVQIDRSSGQSIHHPGEDVTLEQGDKVMLVVRGSRLSAGAVFSAAKGPIRHGRTFVG
ncbi:MAG: potassium channel family protein [Novosphingobium sp.]